MAERLKVDLLVIGYHGRKGVKRYISFLKGDKMMERFKIYIGINV
jgi:hypothetical protein